MFNSIRGILGAGKPSAKEDKQPEFNQNAGAEILSYFQQHWAELHQINEDNAKEASKLAEDILKMHHSVAKDNENLSQIIFLLNSIPNLKTSIGVCVSQIQTLHYSFEEVEKGLHNLENLIEQCDLETSKVEHKHELSLYKEKKLVNLEVARTNLATKHTQHVIEHELKQKKMLQERQQVFQEAFNKDLETYKSLGSIPKIEIPSVQPSALLEEIQLDLDNKELDTFLGDTK